MKAWRFPERDAAATDTDTESTAAQTIGLLVCEVPDPDVAGDSVLVRVQACVVGTPERESAHKHTSAVTPGGAAVGTVVRAGAESAHLVGKRVLVSTEQACGECDICRRGRPMLCPDGTHLGRDRDGAFAQLVSARARWVCPLEDELEHESLAGPHAALLAREVAWAYAMFARAGVAPGEPVFIVGDNLVARFLIDVAVAKGANPMVFCEPGQDRFAAWIEARGGIPLPATPSAVSRAGYRHIAEQAAEQHGHGRRPWFVFETTAHAASRRRALELAVPGVKIVMLAESVFGRASAEAQEEIDARSASLMNELIATDGELIGVAGAHPDLLPEIAALVIRGELELESAARLVSIEDLPSADRWHLDDAPPCAWVATIPD